MKKSTKIILIIIAVVLCLVAAFVLLQKDTDNNVSGNESGNNGSSQDNNASTAFSMGGWSNNVYKNDFLGLEFHLPQGWAYYSQSEIAEMMNIGVELLNDDQKAYAELSKLTSIYYMVANNPNTGNNISILSEKTTVDYTVDYYINQLKTQLASLESVNYTIGETSTKVIAGKAYQVLSVSTNISGVTVVQEYFIRKLDKYFVCIIVTDVDPQQTISDIIANFK